jgi:hypothetical protein
MVIVQRPLPAFGQDFDSANLLYLGTGVICFFCPQNAALSQASFSRYLGMDFSAVRETMTRRQMLS